MGFWAQFSDGFSDASVLGLRRLGIGLARMTSPHSKLSVEGQDSWNLSGILADGVWNYILMLWPQLNFGQA